MGKFVERFEAEKAKFQEMLEDAQAELVELYRQREAVEHSIQNTQQKMNQLAALCGVTVDNPIQQLGLTDAVRHVLGMSKKAMSAIDVRDDLNARKFDLTGCANPLASIHTILKRLVNSGEAKPHHYLSQLTQQIVVIYEWAGGLCPPPPMPQWMKQKVVDGRQVTKSPPPPRTLG